ncbi:MAG: proton-conducting transporter membrane subunit [Actinomycetia bacterium]|nr:proton-conducting transporter membrane subunit [Actinomycetes bacterium]
MRVQVDWLVLVPVLGPAIGALLLLVVDAIAPRQRVAHLAVALVALGAGIGVAGWGALATTSDAPLLTLCLPGPDGACLYAAGAMASVLQVAALGAAAVVVMMLLGDPLRRPDLDALRGGPAVAVALVLAATAGATTVVGAQDLAAWLVGLELATLPMVGLVALAARREAVQGALTLLVTSILSFALLAVGVALWTIATGAATFSSTGIQAAFASSEHQLVLLAAVVVIIAGLGFKLSLVPFHTWTPITYSAAATPVTLALATVSKVAALGGLITVVQAISVLSDRAAPRSVAFTLGAVALVSMLVGALLALRQSDPVRLLAWSTVGQAGWVVLPLAALSVAGTNAAAGYLAAYVVATTVAFAVVHRVHGPVAAEAPVGPRELSHTGGLARNHVLLGGALILALLSLAGLPPGVIGLVAKIAALQPVAVGGLWPFALVAVVGAVLGVAVYLRWVAILLGAGRSLRPLQAMPGTRLALILVTVLLVAVSALPALIFR